MYTLTFMHRVTETKTKTPTWFQRVFLGKKPTQHTYAMWVGKSIEFTDEEGEFILANEEITTSIIMRSAIGEGNVCNVQMVWDEQPTPYVATCESNDKGVDISSADSDLLIRET